MGEGARWWLILFSFSIEMNSPKYGFERFRIKVVQRYNMESDKIMPKIRSRPEPGISCLYVGRDVSQREVRDYLIEYFRKRGLWEHILSIKPTV